MRYIDEQSAITCTLDIQLGNTVDGIMFYIYLYSGKKVGGRLQ